MNSELQKAENLLSDVLNLETRDISKLAVVATYNGEQLPASISFLDDFLYAAVLNFPQRAFQVLERGYLDSALEETQFNRNLLFRDEQDIVNVGEFLPADAILIFDINDSGSYFVFNVRVFRTTDGEVLSARSSISNPLEGSGTQSPSTRRVLSAPLVEAREPEIELDNRYRTITSQEDGQAYQIFSTRIGPPSDPDQIQLTLVHSESRNKIYFNFMQSADEERTIYTRFRLYWDDDGVLEFDDLYDEGTSDASTFTSTRIEADPLRIYQNRDNSQNPYHLVRFSMSRENYAEFFNAAAQGLWMRDQILFTETQRNDFLNFLSYIGHRELVESTPYFFPGLTRMDPSTYSLPPEFHPANLEATLPNPESFLFTFNSPANALNYTGIKRIFLGQFE
jgi:hypothetical protein